MLDLAFDEKAPPARRSGLLAGLSRASTSRKIVPAGDLSRLGTLLNGGDEALRAEAARAVGAWKVEPLRPNLTALASARDTPEPLRHASIDALASLGGPSSLQALGNLAGKDYPPADRRMAVVALATLDPKARRDEGPAHPVGRGRPGRSL